MEVGLRVSGVECASAHIGGAKTIRPGYAAAQAGVLQALHEKQAGAMHGAEMHHDRLG